MDMAGAPVDSSVPPSDLTTIGNDDRNPGCVLFVKRDPIECRRARPPRHVKFPACCATAKCAGADGIHGAGTTRRAQFHSAARTRLAALRNIVQRAPREPASSAKAFDPDPRLFPARVRGRNAQSGGAGRVVQQREFGQPRSGAGQRLGSGLVSRRSCRLRRFQTPGRSRWISASPSFAVPFTCQILRTPGRPPKICQVCNRSPFHNLHRKTLADRYPPAPATDPPAPSAPWRASHEQNPRMSRPRSPCTSRRKAVAAADQGERGFGRAEHH